MVPDTDFPDIRCKCAIHSNNGSCMIIPREGDLIRLYIQLSDRDVVDSSTGRVDKSKMGPEKLLEVAKKSFHPFEIKKSGEIDWWTLYISACPRPLLFVCTAGVVLTGECSRTTGRYAILRA